MSGVPYSGEGADFKLEEVNCLVQQWLPGIPSKTHWLAACVNYMKLKELRETTLQQLGATVHMEILLVKYENDSSNHLDLCPG